jgi:hypothetical protein
MSEPDQIDADLNQETRTMTESRVAKTPSVEEALRRLTNRVPVPSTVGGADTDTDDRSADHTEPEDHSEPQDHAEYEQHDQAEQHEDPEDFEEIDGELHVTTHRYVKRNMGGHALGDREPEIAGLAEQFASDPMFAAPVVDADVLLAALHGGDDEPLRRLSAIAIASEREAILASAKAEAQLLVSEAQSHRKAILAQAESKSEIMIARAEAQAAATLARAEARAQLLELENRNQSIVISQRKKRKQR